MYDSSQYVRTKLLSIQLSLSMMTFEITSLNHRRALVSIEHGRMTQFARKSFHCVSLFLDYITQIYIYSIFSFLHINIRLIPLKV